MLGYRWWLRVEEYYSLTVLSAGVPNSEIVYMWESLSWEQIIITTTPLLHITTFTPTNHQHITFTMAAIEQTWSLEGKVAVVTGSGKHP
jgi:hypothetical protein